LLPLCSGARTSKDGTMLDDLVAICPTCHRSVHRYYDSWLKTARKKDFVDAVQARQVYQDARSKFRAP
jgi:predicted HNH restriction endonuclease